MGTACRIIEIVLTQLPQPSWRSTAWRETDRQGLSTSDAGSECYQPISVALRSRDLRMQHAAIFEAAKPARWKQMLALHRSHHFRSGTWI